MDLWDDANAKMVALLNLNLNLIGMDSSLVYPADYVKKRYGNNVATWSLNLIEIQSNNFFPIIFELIWIIFHTIHWKISLQVFIPLIFGRVEDSCLFCFLKSGHIPEDHWAVDQSKKQVGLAQIDPAE